MTSGGAQWNLTRAACRCFAPFYCKCPKLLSDRDRAQLVVNGQVESALFSGLDKLVCKYQWAHGRDWSVKMVRWKLSGGCNAHHFRPRSGVRVSKVRTASRQRSVKAIRKLCGTFLSMQLFRYSGQCFRVSLPDAGLTVWPLIGYGAVWLATVEPADLRP